MTKEANRNKLEPTDVSQFLARFGNFHDAVIHEINIGLFSGKQLPRKATIVLGVQDRLADNKWMNLILEIEGLTQINLFQRENYNFSIANWLVIGFFDNKIGLDFFPGNRESPSPADFKERGNASNINKWIGKECYWHLSDYEQRSR